MPRRRAPQFDYICLRCGLPCDFERHLGGGTMGLRACGYPVRPILRSEFEAMFDELVEIALELPRESGPKNFAMMAR